MASGLSLKSHRPPPHPLPTFIIINFLIIIIFIQRYRGSNHSASVCKRKSTAIDNLVQLAPLDIDILEAAIKKKRKIMRIKGPVPVTKSSIPVQSHAFLDKDIKRMDIGLTDRQTLKSAKYDRLLYGRENVQPGLRKHLVHHKSMRDSAQLKTWNLRRKSRWQLFFTDHSIHHQGQHCQGSSDA